MIINCALIEDEPPARAKAEAYIARVPFLNLVASVGSPLAITTSFTELDVKLVFSDILMPDIKGTEFLRALHQKPAFVFISADPSFAVESFELSVIDFILKPYTFERFYQACLKAREAVQQPITEPSDPARGGYIAVKVNYQYRIIYHHEVIFITAEKDYVNIVTETGSYLHHCTLKKLLENELPPEVFIQTERSCIINTHRIHTIGSHSIKMEGGNHEVSLGETFRDAVYRHLGLPLKKRKAKKG